MACRKRRYATHAEAMSDLARIVARCLRQVVSKTPRRAYECRACRGWHLTSQSPQGVR